MPELTDSFCQAAMPMTGLQAEFHDTVVRGLSLLASKGGTKSFYLTYTRGADGKRARMKLGRYPEMTLGKAREKARDARAEIEDSNDPLVEKAAETVSDLVENYIRRGVPKKRFAKEIARRLRQNVSSVIGYVKLADLHNRDITSCIDALEDLGADIEANRVSEDVRAMVRWAKTRGDLDVNFVEQMRNFHEATERDRALSDYEIRTMWSALPSAVMEEGTRRILRLCLITGQRAREVSGMTRNEIKLDRGLWVIPPLRLKRGLEHGEHTVPLSPMALDIIREQIAFNEAVFNRKHGTTPNYLFPDPGGKAAVTVGSVSKALEREAVTKRGITTILGIAPWRPSDLRRTAASRMAELEALPYIIAHVLGHMSVTKASMTGNLYDTYDYSREKREALEVWANRLASVVNRGADLIPLSTRATDQNSIG